MDRESKRRRAANEEGNIQAVALQQLQQETQQRHRQQEEEEGQNEVTEDGNYDEEEDEEGDEEEDEGEEESVTITRHQLHSSHNPAAAATASTNLLSHPNVKIVKVVPLPHARSEVWSYFGFIADDDGEIQDRKKAICKICATTLSYSGNTTNMFTHLKAMHPEATPQKLQPTNKFPRTGRKAPSKRKFLEAIANTGHLEIEYPNASNNSQTSGGSSNSYIIRVHSTSNGTEQVFEETLSVSPSSSSPVQTNATSSSVICVNSKNSSSITRGLNASDMASSSALHHNHKVQPQQQSNNNVCSIDDITNAIVDMIVKDCRPLCITNGKGFQSLLRLLAPGYQIPDHKRLELLVKNKYDDLRRELILKGMQGET